MAGTDRLRDLYPNIPSFEWDRGACGIGLIANIDGRATKGLVAEALYALSCLSHRGAASRVDARDPGTSDGVGIMVDLPLPFLEEAFHLRSPLSHPGTAGGADGDGDGDAHGPLASGKRQAATGNHVGLGMLFLPADRADEARGLVDRSLRATGLPILGWRDVPTEPEILGSRARASMPTIAQALVERPEGVDGARFERLLYRARRRIERRARRDGLPLTVASLSSQTVVYKGLVPLKGLGDFFTDLQHPQFSVSVAMYHQRYATNTLPDWALAQPFHRLCHNGEINTLMGNRGWVAAREQALSPRARRLLSPLLDDGSDSAQLDRLVEALALEGVSPVEALLGLVPEAHAATPQMHPRLRAWYRLMGALREPWDGPAALLYCDDRWAVAHLDRNGLRPLFVQETRGNRGTGRPAQLVIASEQGVTTHRADDIVYSHQLGPGELVALDRHSGRCYHDKEIKAELIALTQDWEGALERHIIAGGTALSSRQAPGAAGFLRLQLAAGVTTDDLTYFMLPMVRKGKEAVWSMGDDSQLTPFVSRPRLFADHLRQRFAQVTNPPIDPYRERAVFDTTTYLGRLDGFFGGPLSGQVITLESPVLSADGFAWVTSQRAVRRFSTTFSVAGGVDSARQTLDALVAAALESARAGASTPHGLDHPVVLVLSDRDGEPMTIDSARAVDARHAALPMPLAVGAVHQALIRAGLRTRVGLVADACDAWHEHHLAVLLGLGADAAHPWMALRWAEQLGEEDEESRPDPGGERLRRVLQAGVVKVMSKMGICAMSSYIGSQLFDSLGLEPEVVALCCPGVAHWGSGVGFADLVADVLGFHGAAWSPDARLTEQGFVRFRKGGLLHAFDPKVFSVLPKVVSETEAETECVVTQEGAPPERFVPAFEAAMDDGARGRYAAWAKGINDREPITVGDRYAIVSDRAPIPLEEVEPIWRILDDREGLGRVCGGAMSWGSLSDEAHEDIAVAMNRVGARSNTGEGGERAHRYGTAANSAIKQVASARFGVTPQYLHYLQEWQIKMAQGSKPGEGGQLPGHKVSANIAEVRGSSPGVELISPPPHHDIYSIEDLAELMYELTQFNPTARGNVKLVSATNVAIVAAGVAKGGTQTVHIAGHSGGTGASPLSSIKFAGLPWELGVQMSHQVLHANSLRERVKIVADGGIQTGRQAVKAFLLGAEGVGLGSVLLVAEGCIMARQCHLNTCPTGIATQSKRLRAKYAGKPVHLIKYLVLFAEEIRCTLAEMGYRSVGELVGRTDLLRPRELSVASCQLPVGRTDEGQQGTVNRQSDGPAPMDPTVRGIRFDRELLGRPLPLREKHRTVPTVSALNTRLLEDAAPLLDELPVASGQLPVGDASLATGNWQLATPLAALTLRYGVGNTDRAVGATLAGRIVAATGTRGLPAPIDVQLEGYAGQALGFGAWGGLRITLHGRANDYVGKAMSTGGLIAVSPPEAFGCPPDSTALVGNTVGFGATGGELYVAGRAGQRFMCRNSGAVAVVEGVGPHGCEYMTKGTVVVLGTAGLNFAAGMTGGTVYLLDGFTAEEQGLLNTDYVRVEPLSPEEQAEDGPLHALLAAHHRWTGSPLAAEALRYWPFYARYRFDRVVSVVPRAAVADE